VRTTLPPDQAGAIHDGGRLVRSSWEAGVTGGAYLDDSLSPSR
jgi:hypothetical protein